MWALLLVAGALTAIWLSWRHSGLCWWDYFVLHGARAYTRLWHRWSCNRPAPLPPGPALVISNHTCSADPTFLLAGCPRTMAFLVAVEHFNVHPVARWLLDYLQCVPVSRNGRDFISLRKALKRLASGRALCIFPEGNLSGVAKNRLLPPKLGIGFLALYTRIPVYPIYVAGGPRTEKLLYSWLFPSSRSVRVIYGDPVNLEKYYNKPITRQLVVEVTESLMHEVARLAPRPSISAEADADL